MSRQKLICDDNLGRREKVFLNDASCRQSCQLQESWCVGTNFGASIVGKEHTSGAVITDSGTLCLLLLGVGGELIRICNNELLYDGEGGALVLYLHSYNSEGP